MGGPAGQLRAPASRAPSRLSRGAPAAHPAVGRTPGAAPSRRRRRIAGAAPPAAANPQPGGGPGEPRRP
eukprot:4657862-Alexandrium_andersonii.AAC.1